MFFSLSSTLTPCSISVKVVCLLCVCVCMSVKLYVCVCLNLGCSDAELLSLHRSSPHTWCFWGCRWRLSTSISPYLTHPPTSPLFCVRSPVFLFLFSSVPTIFSCIICFFYLVHQPPCFFYFLCFILLQDVDPSSGIACFRPLITILPVFVFFILAAPLFCQGPDMFFFCFLSIILFSPSSACNVT